MHSKIILEVDPDYLSLTIFPNYSFIHYTIYISRAANNSEKNWADYEQLLEGEATVSRLLYLKYN